MWHSIGFSWYIQILILCAYSPWHISLLLDDSTFMRVITWHVWHTSAWLILASTWHISHHMNLLWHVWTSAWYIPLMLTSLLKVVEGCWVSSSLYGDGNGGHGLFSHTWEYFIICWCILHYFMDQLAYFILFIFYMRID